MVSGAEEVTTTNVTVSWMIKLAYNVHAHQISGGPAWLDSERYDTVGQPDTPGQPSRDQMKLMIQKLLADRFQLTVPHGKEGTAGVCDGGGQKRPEDHRERRGIPMISPESVSEGSRE